MSTKVLTAATVTFFTAGIVMLIISLTTNYWIVVDLDSHETHAGLFEWCVDSHCYSNITNYKLIGDQDTIIGLCVSGAVLSAISVLIMAHFAYTCNKITSRSHAWLCFSVGSIAALLPFVATVDFVMNYDTSEYIGLIDTLSIHFGYSYHLVWASAVCIGFGACLSIGAVSSAYRAGLNSGAIVQNNLRYLPFNNMQQQAAPAVWVSHPGFQVQNQYGVPVNQYPAEQLEPPKQPYP